jgi:hypothetical protein
MQAEQQDAGGAPDEDPDRNHTTDGGRHRDEGRDAGIAEVGELSSGGPPARDIRDPANGTPSESGTTGRHHSEPVREPRPHQW